MADGKTSVRVFSNSISEAELKGFVDEDLLVFELEDVNNHLSAFNVGNKLPRSMLYHDLSIPAN